MASPLGLFDYSHDFPYPRRVQVGLLTLVDRQPTETQDLTLEGDDDDRWQSA
ncbi:MAG: hypothetical protein JO166_24925 [Deltaproteobacteria bacterium]|nr:hypothetical protein [Deltaproteobacteria bacterium]